MEDTSLNHIREPILAEITSLPATNSSQLPQKENQSTSDDKRLPEECFGNPSTTTGIHRLPNEILIKIIAGLRLKDRKNTRLVCKRWLNVNNIRQISTKEKISCVGRHDVDLILQTIQNSERRIINLRFVEVNFSVQDRDRSFEFWKACGWKIESLSFFNCCFSDKTLLFMIEHCAKMKKLIIVNSLEPTEQKLIPSSAIETLKEMNLRRENLKSLKMDCNIMSFNFLKVMVDIYPNLDHFEHYLYSGYLTKKEILDLLQDESSFEYNLHKTIGPRMKIRVISWSIEFVDRNITIHHIHQNSEED